MKIFKAIDVLKNEWRNIKISLEQCGEIGEIKSETNDIGIILLEHGPILLRNAIEMDKRYIRQRYFNNEAGYVFSILASKAAKNLGLRKEFAETFGAGYGWVRSGALYIHEIRSEYLVKQLFFFKSFFPIDGCFNWSFDADTTKTKMQYIYSNFSYWQANPDYFMKDLQILRKELGHFWRGITSRHDIYNELILQ